MSKMYVANCTPQVQDFNYRLLEQAGLRMQQVPVGGQIELSGNLSTPDIEAIIKQHERYGMVPTHEAGQRPARVTLCYSLDKPVPAAIIQRAIEHNWGVMSSLGKEQRQKSAVELHHQLESNVNGLGALSVSVEELKGENNRPPEMVEGTRVTRREDPGPTAPPASRRRRAA